MSQDKKIAVVIGATGNLGRAIVLELEKCGFWVDPLWLGEGRPDVTLHDAFKSLPPKIDAAIYLAGINAIFPAEDLEEVVWDKVFDINLKGAFRFAKAAYPSLTKVECSSFITISSIMVTHPYPGRLAYAASKAGLESMTRCLAVEWGKKGVSSHTLRLGHISGLMKSTVANPKILESVKSLTPSGNLIEPESVASYIGWLVNGGIKSVNGMVSDFEPGYTINRWPLNS